MKGQFSIDYYIALVIFIFFVMYLAFQLLSIMPNYTREVQNQRLRSEAFQISELLINDVGFPSNWDSIYLSNISQVKRIGLSTSTQNKTNLVSILKVNALNEICKRADRDVLLHNWIGTDFQLSLLIVDRTSGSTVATCQPVSAIARANIISVNRIIAFTDGRYAEFILQMWEGPK